MFSKVYLGTHILSGTKVAIKVLTRIATDEGELNREVRAMKLVRGHPHIVTLFEVFEDSENIYMIMDYCLNGTLDSHIMRHGKVSIPTSDVWQELLVTRIQRLGWSGLGGYSNATTGF
jgi:serine/threonine protein kinase